VGWDVAWKGGIPRSNVRVKLSPLTDLETIRVGPGETAPATVQAPPPETTLDCEIVVDEPPAPTVTVEEFCAVLVWPLAVLLWLMVVVWLLEEGPD